MFVVWSFPTPRQLVRHPAVQVLAVAMGLYALQRYAQHRAGDDSGFLVFMICFGGLFAARWVFLAIRWGRRMTLRLRLRRRG